MALASVEREVDCLSLAVPWRGVRYIKGARMVEVNVYWFYWMSMTVYRLHLLRTDLGPVPLSVLAPELGMARVALESFGDEQGRAFPKTAGAIKNLLGIIDKMMPERQPNQVFPTADKMIPAVEVVELRNALNSLGVFLKDEGEHSFVLCVENQRFLSASNLVDRIESCFDAEIWKVIDNAAKREFEESGRCLALERYTSSGFHALRGVECVIRQYIVKLTGALPRKRDWGHYVEVLKSNGADPALTAVLDNIRSLERNPLMHPEDWLDIDDAIGIFTIAQTAIVRLVAGIKK